MASITAARCSLLRSIQTTASRPSTSYIQIANHSRKIILHVNKSLIGCVHHSQKIHSMTAWQTCLQGRTYGTFSRHGILGQCVGVITKRQGTSLLYVRAKSGRASESSNMDKNDALLYTLSIVIFMSGMAYAGVPFFKMFCRQFGFGGNPEISRGHDRSKVGTMQRVDDRLIKVNFEADRHTSMRWNFRPQQASIVVKPGETALAFYTAENPTEEAIIGISTYTVTPYKAAPYFNKIQCFCFEEQILNPHEQVDMPVFFYIDPEFDEDPHLEFEDEISLSYTFFKAREGMSLPLPGFLKNRAETPLQETSS